MSLSGGKHAEGRSKLDDLFVTLGKTTRKILAEVV